MPVPGLWDRNQVRGYDVFSTQQHVPRGEKMFAQQGKKPDTDNPGDHSADSEQEAVQMLNADGLSIERIQIDGTRGYLMRGGAKTEATTDGKYVLLKVLSFLGLTYEDVMSVLPNRIPEERSGNHEVELWHPLRRKEAAGDKQTESESHKDIEFQLIEVEDFDCDWYKYPEKIYGKTRARQNGDVLRITRSGYNTNVTVYKSDIEKMLLMEKPAINIALSKLKEPKKTMVRIYLREYYNAEIESSCLFEEAPPFAITGRPDVYRGVFVWDFNGRYAAGKRSTPEKIFITKKDAERLVAIPKDELKKWVEGLPEIKKEILIEFIETLKDIRMGAFNKIKADTKPMEDSGNVGET